MFHFALDQETELKLLEDRHAEELFAAVDLNRAHLRQWLPFLDTTNSPADTRAFVQRTLNQFLQHSGPTAGIWHRKRIAGVVGFNRINVDFRHCELGYWLGVEHQGKGIITRACSAMTDHAFGELKLNRVEIRCAPGNTKSRAIPIRLGFKEEGCIRQTEWLYDHFVDNVVYGMLASEWIRPML